MPVHSIITPRTNAQNVALTALLHGVQAEGIDQDDNHVYIDLTGSDEKCIAVVNATGADLICETEAVPHEDPVYTNTGRTWV